MNLCWRCVASTNLQNSTWPSALDGLPLQQPFTLLAQSIQCNNAIMQWKPISSINFQHMTRLIFSDMTQAIQWKPITSHSLLHKYLWRDWPSGRCWAPHKCSFLSFARCWWLGWEIVWACIIAAKMYINAEEELENLIFHVLPSLVGKYSTTMHH